MPQHGPQLGPVTEATADADAQALLRAEIAVLRADLAGRARQIAPLQSRLDALTAAHLEAGERAARSAGQGEALALLQGALTMRLRQRDFGAEVLARQAEAVAQSPLFDADWYRQRYLAGDGGVDAARHYTALGAFLGHDPGPEFDTCAYCRANEDVAQAGVAALAHYELFGRGESRALR